jgi:hypothetical protein
VTYSIIFPQITYILMLFVRNVEQGAGEAEEARRQGEQGKQGRQGEINNPMPNAPFP